MRPPNAEAAPKQSAPWVGDLGEEIGGILRRGSDKAERPQGGAHHQRVRRPARGGAGRRRAPLLVIPFVAGTGNSPGCPLLAGVVIPPEPCFLFFDPDVHTTERRECGPKNWSGCASSEGVDPDPTAKPAPTADVIRSGDDATFLLAVHRNESSLPCPTPSER